MRLRMELDITASELVTGIRRLDSPGPRQGDPESDLSDAAAFGIPGSIENCERDQIRDPHAAHFALNEPNDPELCDSVYSLPPRAMRGPIPPPLSKKPVCLIALQYRH